MHNSQQNNMETACNCSQILQQSAEIDGEGDSEQKCKRLLLNDGSSAAWVVCVQFVQT